MLNLTTEVFIEKARKVHADRYNYDKTYYIATKESVTITCKVHGDFTKVASYHLKGYGCPKCSLRSRDYFKYDTEMFIRKSKEKHGDLFTYENTKYINAKTLVTIGCKVHGDVLVNPYTHLKGSGCRKCADKINSINYTKPVEQFIKEAQEVHKGLYTYELMEYVNCSHKVTITCPHHGTFRQTPMNHLLGTGCRACQGSSVYFMDIPTTTYYIMITNPEGYSIYKVGITTKQLNKRFISELARGYLIDILDTIEFYTGKPAYALEQYILNKEVNGKYRKSEQFLYKGIGDSELFTEPLNKSLSDIHNIIHKGNL